MNVLYVNANQRNKLSDAAGYATHMAKTIKGLEGAGHCVVKFLAGENQEAQEAKRAYRTMRNYIPRGAARVVRDVYEVFYDRRLYRRWLPLAARHRIRFVYERMNQLHTVGLRLARQLGIPFVIEINDPMRETVTVDLSGLMKRYAIFLEDRLVRESDFVVLGSEELKKSYVRRGSPSDRFLVLYPTADLDLFKLGNGRPATRQQYDLDGKVVVGLVAGNLSARWRRLDLLLDALPLIARQQPRFAALIVGEGKLGLPGPAAASADPGPRVAVTGKVAYNEVPKYLDSMDICLIPHATWYGSPTKLFEYGAMAKPVVAPRLPPIEEVIEDGVTGLLFEPENQADMVRQILTLLDNASLRAQLGHNLRQKITSQFTWEKNTSALINAIAGCAPTRA